ncbi:MAG: hypothetical protein JXR97_04555 [Planctomycetes bacterium]|nr:hypothetical protein [Planctomycetota bacterium]
MIGKTPVEHSARRKARLVGYGLDSNGGHIRITISDDFRLEGGSEEVHQEMQEKAALISDELRRKGISLSSMTREEFEEVNQMLATIF